MNRYANPVRILQGPGCVQALPQVLAEAADPAARVLLLVWNPELCSLPVFAQLLARGEKHLLDRNRTYFKLLRQLVTDGQKMGQLRADRSANEIVKAYALWERALLYDWCLCGGEYSLVSYTDSVTPMYLESYRAFS